METGLTILSIFLYLTTCAFFYLACAFFVKSFDDNFSVKNLLTSAVWQFNPLY